MIGARWLRSIDSIRRSARGIYLLYAPPPQQERHPRQARQPDEAPMARRPVARQGCIAVVAVFRFNADIISITMRASSQRSMVWWPVVCAAGSGRLLSLLSDQRKEII